jgi:hypothetical protein
MEQSCYKCGQLVEEGIAFCPHCTAPQIRVIVAEPPGALAVAADAPRSVAATAGLRSADLRSDTLPASETLPVLAVPMRWSQALKSCLLAAFLASLLMALGLNPFVSIFSAGFLAVVLCRQGQPGAFIRAGAGIRLGALSGLLSFGITSLLVSLAAMVPEFRAKMREQILENAQKWAGAHPADPQVQAALDQLKTPQGFVMMVIIGGALLLVLSIVLGGFGGALAGAIFNRRDRS